MKNNRLSLSKLLFEQEVSWDDKYEQFVQKLGDNAKDPKTRSFINAGLKDGYSDDDKFSFSSKDLAVKDLVPTQNEVDIDKSLAFPMKKRSWKVCDLQQRRWSFYTGLSHCHIQRKICD
jgi:hypothetical protein